MKPKRNKVFSTCYRFRFHLPNGRCSYYPVGNLYLYNYCLYIHNIYYYAYEVSTLICRSLAVVIVLVNQCQVPHLLVVDALDEGLPRLPEKAVVVNNDNLDMCQKCLESNHTMSHNN